MVSKAEIKRIRSLYVKKYRQEAGLFVAEGHKTVEELLPYLQCEKLYAVEGCDVPANWNSQAVSRSELDKMSNMEAPQDVLAVFRMPQPQLEIAKLAGQLTVALDGVRDAGNLGTIIRLCDWFGVEDVLCSVDTVDAFNPKTVQATAGALARVRVHYCKLAEVLEDVKALGCPVYATALDGEDLYACKGLDDKGLVLVFGNEGKGVSAEVMHVCNRKFLIPNYPLGRKTTESLNVGTAAAVTIAEVRRRHRI